MIFENVTTLFVDLDDTVFNFKKAEHVAISDALLSVGIEPTEEIIAQYSAINLALWKDLERGLITREFLMLERFRLFYLAKGIEDDPGVIARRYVENLSKGHYWLEGSREALVELRKKYKIYIASNGTSRVQRSRINSSDLESLVDGIFISEEVGINKPAIEFFETCLAKTGAKREECIMIGDSLSSDIKGGKNAGLRTIWISHGKKDTENDADLCISSLYELVNIL